MPGAGGPGEQPGHGPPGAGGGPGGQPPYGAPGQSGAAGWGGEPWAGQLGYPGQPWDQGAPEGPQRKGLGTGALVALIVAIVVVVAGGAGGAGYFFLTRGDDSAGGGGRPQAGGGKPSAAPPSPSTALPDTYTDADAGITMKLPQGWEKYENPPLPDTSGGAFGLPYPCPYGDDRSRTCYKGSLVTGTMPEDGNWETPRDRAVVIGGVIGPNSYGGFELDENEGETFNVLDETEADIDGKNAYRIRFTMKIPDSEVTPMLESVVIKTGGKWVFALFASDQVEGAPPMTLFEAMMRTMTVK